MAADPPPAGSILWRDLTVPDATRVRDFYKAVVGWTSSDVPMGGYADYCMDDSAGETVAGICHARGLNAKVPPQWLMYVAVADVAQAATCAVELGGQIMDGPRLMGGKNFCVVRDPAGAVIALIEP